MDNVQIATDAIRNIKTNDELDQLVEVFKLQRTYFSRNVARTLMIGDTVSFDANTRGVIKGKVTKGKLRSMTKQQLLDEAKNVFDVELDPKDNKTTLINKVYNLHHKK